VPRRAKSSRLRTLRSLGPSCHAFTTRGGTIRQLRVVIVIAFLVLGVALGFDKKIVSPLGTRPGSNPSQDILIDGTLYISGQGGEDATGKIPGDFDTEGRQCLDNIGAMLKAAGIVPPYVVSVPVYLTDSAKSRGRRGLR
jgi:hypothetical protein